MSIRSIHLRKLMKILYLPQNKRVSALRDDIRDDIAREDGGEASGGDFYGPFWRDAKDHVFGQTDLREMTKIRIEANPRRANLYPLLRDGFLEWWDRRRRWTNEPFQRAETIKGIYRFEEFGASVKLGNILCVKDARDDDHFVYPYWFPTPLIEDEAARLSLWLLRQTFSSTDPDELRVLDVIRGRTFSLDRNPLRGDEEKVFKQRYTAIIRQWDTLRKEY